jgi:hypothetical protein
MCYLLVIFFPWLSPHILSEDPYIWPRVVELLSKVAKRITFEEQVIDININRLQEVVDPWLCLIVPMRMSAFSWVTYVTTIGSKGHTTLNVGQVISWIRIDHHMVFLAWISKSWSLCACGSHNWDQLSLVWPLVSWLRWRPFVMHQEWRIETFSVERQLISYQ